MLNALCIRVFAFQSNRFDQIPQQQFRECLHLVNESHVLLAWKFSTTINGQNHLYIQSWCNNFNKIHNSIKLVMHTFCRAAQPVEIAHEICWRCRWCAGILLFNVYRVFVVFLFTYPKWICKCESNHFYGLLNHNYFIPKNYLCSMCNCFSHKVNANIMSTGRTGTNQKPTKKKIKTAHRECMNEYVAGNKRNQSERRINMTRNLAYSLTMAKAEEKQQHNVPFTFRHNINK